MSRVGGVDHNLNCSPQGPGGMQVLERWQIAANHLSPHLSFSLSLSLSLTTTSLESYLLHRLNCLLSSPLILIPPISYPRRRAVYLTRSSCWQHCWICCLPRPTPPPTPSALPCSTWRPTLTYRVRCASVAAILVRWIRDQPHRFIIGWSRKIYTNIISIVFVVLRTLPTGDRPCLGRKGTGQFWRQG